MAETGFNAGGSVLVAGTYDTKSPELNFIADRLKSLGVSVTRVDLSTSGKASNCEVNPADVGAFHADGVSAVQTGDRGTSVAGMSQAFEAWIEAASNVGGIISAGGTGGTALSTPAMRALPLGIPKIMISTVASGDVSAYVGASDIMMLPSISDVQGLHSISRQIFSNAADAMVGLVQNKASQQLSAGDDKPNLGMTMFGVTTAAIQQISAHVSDDFECLVFHATGIGGRSMEKLADDGFLSAVLDLTTTEVCDLLFGGVFAATEDRFGAVIRKGLPYVGSVGALDMVNFGAPDTVPAKYEGRTFYEHNPQVTLMRTTAEENTQMGHWIADRLNQMTGPVRFFLPEGGVSAIDAPGAPFEDKAARKALFDAIKEQVQETENRKLITSPHHINDEAFAQECVAALREVTA